MMLVIIGCDKVEVSTIKERTGKHFYMTRGQLYKCYPDGTWRVMWTRKNPHFWQDSYGSDSMIVYDENYRVPRVCLQPVLYDQESVLRDIDEHKITARTVSRLWYKPYLEAGRSIWKTLAMYGGVGLAGGIVVWALIFA